MPEWQPIEMPYSQAVDLAREKGRRLEVYWAEFNTDIEEEKEDLRTFLFHPLDSLTGTGRHAIGGLAIDGVDRTWRITTTIHNHHRGLNPRITRFMATVSDEEKAVDLNVHKEPAPSTDGGQSGPL